ncbi:MAG: tetratricopeptide repeat protein [Cyanobacteria bacterium J06626_14]
MKPVRRSHVIEVFYCDMEQPIVTVLICVISVLSLGCSPPPSSTVMNSFGRSLKTLEPMVEAATPLPSPEEKAQASTLRGDGLALRNQGRLEESIAALQQSVDLDPTHLDGYVILGWTQHLNGQRDAAQTTLKQAIARDAEHIPALNALGIVYLVDGQLEQAVQTHTQALELNPKNEIAAYNLSLAYQRLQQYTAAIEHAILATELEPYNPHPWVALAIAQDGAGDVAASEDAYRRALLLDGRYRYSTYLDHLEQAGFSGEQIQLTVEILNRL